MEEYKINELGKRKYELVNVVTKEIFEYSLNDIKIIEKALKNKNNLIIKDNNLIEKTDMIETLIEPTAEVKPTVTLTKNIQQIINESVKAKPNDLIMSDLDWKYLVRNVLKGLNTLMVGATGTGKTSTAYAVAKMLGREDRFFKFPMNSTGDAKSFLIGSMQYSPEKGTYFKESEFVKAIKTPNAIILLDEYTRSHPDAENILFSVLDHQRYLKIDEGDYQENVKVAEGVTFIATANIGNKYTTTRIMDKATTDRFLLLETRYLTEEEEVKLMSERYGNVDEEDVKSIVKIANETRNMEEEGELEDSLSTRKVGDIISLINDGFTAIEAVQKIGLPLYVEDGTSESDRQKFKTIIDKHLVVDTSTSEMRSSNISNDNIFKSVFEK